MKSFAEQLKELKSLGYRMPEAEAKVKGVRADGCFVCALDGKRVCS